MIYLTLAVPVFFLFFAFAWSGAPYWIVESLWRERYGLSPEHKHMKELGVDSLKNQQRYCIALSVLSGICVLATWLLLSYPFAYVIAFAIGSVVAGASFGYTLRVSCSDISKIQKRIEER